MAGRTRYKQRINLLELSKEELTKEEIEKKCFREEFKNEI